MNFLEKLENAVNSLLILIGNLFMRALSKLIPPKVQAWLTKAKDWIVKSILWLKNLPKLIISQGPALIKKAKGTLATFDYKTKLQETYKAAMARYSNSHPGAKVSEAKRALLAPFLIFGEWLKGLNTTQTLMLLGFTAASVLAAVNILFSGHRLMNHHMNESRSPASVEDQVSYDRPDYYKKQTRHLDMTSLRLPVYFANVNELRTIDVDFSATLSNRLSRMKLEKLEFQLRDHLILNVEPMLASFPLEDEGKEILREKLIMEINDFMASHEIEGEVKDLKLTYILAN